MASCSPYANRSATRAVLDAHGLTAKYSLGQNFLVSDDVVRKIIDLADVSSADRILEVGPGIGTLTAALLQHAAQVTAVECDTDLPAVLADTLAPWADRFTLIGKDALALEEDDLVPDARGASGASASCVETTGLPPTKFVANLPYAVAATCILDYFERFPFIESATVMVQKEVADRIAAEPGTKSYGAYTVKLRLHAQVTGRFAVGPGNFFPPPRVESSVIRLDRVQRADAAGPLDAKVLKAACMMADAAFTNRRKTLANSCRTYFAGRARVTIAGRGADASAAIPRAEGAGEGVRDAGRPVGAPGAVVAAALPVMFEHAGIDPRRRGETLSLAEFVSLGRELLATVRA